MTIAVWIIAIVEVIRILQNSLQLTMMLESRKATSRNMDMATEELIKSFKRSDKEWLDNLK